MPTVNSSSSPPADERLVWVPLEHLHPHPANANRMSEERGDTLTRLIDHGRRYPPIVVRPHPDGSGDYQLLDGEQRLAALRRLGNVHALCYVWDCDDQAALLLLATLNRLHGEDVPVKRAEIVAELAALMPLEQLTLLLPEDAGEIEDLLALLEVDTDRLLADLASAAAGANGGVRSITFAVTAEEEMVIEDAVSRAADGLKGKNRRGRALAAIAAYFVGRGG